MGNDSANGAPRAFHDQRRERRREAIVRNQGRHRHQGDLLEQRQVFATVDDLAAADGHDGVELLWQGQTVLKDDFDVVGSGHAFVGDLDLGRGQRNVDGLGEHGLEALAIEERDLREAFAAQVFSKLVKGVRFDAQKGGNGDFHGWVSFRWLLDRQQIDFADVVKHVVGAVGKFL